MKPTWDDAPDWAQWLAMDANGHWWWYASKPRLEAEQWRNAWATQIREAGTTPGRLGWFETLEQRP